MHALRKSGTVSLWILASQLQASRLLPSKMLDIQSCPTLINLTYTSLVQTRLHTSILTCQVVLRRNLPTHHEHSKGRATQVSSPIDAKISSSAATQNLSLTLPSTLNRFVDYHKSSIELCTFSIFSTKPLKLNSIIYLLISICPLIYWLIDCQLIRIISCFFLLNLH